MNHDWTIYTRNYFAIFLSTFGFFMTLYILLTPMPLYANVLGIEEALIGLIVGIFTIMAVIARLIAGPFANRWPKLLLALGSTIFFLAPLMYILSDSLLELVAVRIFHGAGMIFTIASMTLVAKMTPQTRLGEAIGVYGGFVGAAQVLGFFLSGLLIDSLGFTGTFYVGAGFALLSGLSGAFIRDDWPSEDRLINPFGEYRKVLNDRNVRLASIGVILLTFTYGVLIAFGPLHLQDLEISPTNIGIFFTLIAVGIMMGRPVAGRLSDTKGRIPVILPAMLLTAFSVYALSEFATTRFLYFIAILYGLGFGSAYSVQSALAIDTIDLQYKGSALAMFTACFDLGFSIGSIGIGFLAGTVLIGYSLFFQATSVFLLAGIGIFAYFSSRRTLVLTS